MSSDLPDGWTWATLGEVGHYLNGRAFKAADWKEQGRPIIRIQNLTGSSRHHNHYQGEVKDRHLVRDGDLLLSWAATLGVFVWRGEEAVLNQHIFKVESWIFKDFHRWLLQYVLDDLYRQAHGSGMVHITKGKFDTTSVPIPPLAEQERIVAAIEEHFSRLDAASNAITAAQARIEASRRCVLAEAFAGQLAPQDPNDETASALLDRIAADRRTGPAARRTHPGPGRVTGDLPSGWAWARLEDLAAAEPRAITDGPFGSNLKTAHYTRSGPRVIRLQNIGDGVFTHEDAHISEEHYLSLIRHSVQEGDLVVASLGETLPRACLVPSWVPPAIVKADCVRVRLHPEVNSSYVNFALRHPSLRQQTSTKIKGVGRPRLGLKGIRSLAVPLAPIAEQQRVVGVIEEHFARLDAASQAIAAAQARIEASRRSVLSEAFTGRLVPQDPNDEPASVLLERIAASRTARPKRRKVEA